MTATRLVGAYRAWRAESIALLVAYVRAQPERFRAHVDSMGRFYDELDVCGATRAQADDVCALLDALLEGERNEREVWPLLRVAAMERGAP